MPRTRGAVKTRDSRTSAETVRDPSPVPDDSACMGCAARTFRNHEGRPASNGRSPEAADGGPQMRRSGRVRRPSRKREVRVVHHRRRVCGLLRLVMRRDRGIAVPLHDRPSVTRTHRRRTMSVARPWTRLRRCAQPRPSALRASPSSAQHRKAEQGSRGVRCFSAASQCPSPAGLIASSTVGQDQRRLRRAGTLRHRHSRCTSGGARQRPQGALQRRFTRCARCGNAEGTGGRHQRSIMRSVHSRRLRQRWAHLTARGAPRRLRR